MNCRRRCILKKKHDVTITTSSGHVTLSGSCPMDRPWPHSYRMSIGTIPLSGFVSEILKRQSCDNDYYVMTSSMTS